MTKHRVPVLRAGRNAFRSTAFATAAIIAMAVAVAACGGGSSSTATPRTGGTGASATTAPTQTTSAPASTSKKGGSTVDACAVITEQEATTVLGADPGPGQMVAAGAGYCRFGSRPPIANVVLARNVARTEFYDRKRTDSQQSHASSFQDLNGVGDAAFMWHDGPEGEFVFLKGETTVDIAVQAAVEPAGFADKLATLGHIALGRV